LKASSTVIWGIALSLSLALMIISFIPPNDDFMPDNPFWNGMSMASAETGPLFLQSLGNTSAAAGDALFIIGPSKDFTDDEVSMLRSHLLSGGTIVLADDFGSGNQLLERLGLKVRLNGSLLVDPLFKERDMRLPRILMVSKELVENPDKGIVLNYATVIEGCDNSLASSSSFSFLDIDLDGVYDEHEPKGPFTVICRMVYGDGRLILISDSSLFINAMLTMDNDNKKLLEGLAGGHKMLVDTGHWMEGVLTTVKRWLSKLYGIASTAEARYTLVALLLILIARKEVNLRRRGGDELDLIISRNPGWDKALLAKLKEEMVDEK